MFSQIVFNEGKTIISPGKCKQHTWSIYKYTFIQDIKTLMCSKCEVPFKKKLSVMTATILWFSWQAIEGTYIDKKCPFTGNVSIRGRILTGIVASQKMKRTIVIRRDYLHHIKKYNRFEKRHKNLSAHLSPCFRFVSLVFIKTMISH